MSDTNTHDEDEDKFKPVFPKARMDEMQAHAKAFVSAAWADKHGVHSALDSHRSDASLAIAGRLDSGAETMFLARQLELIRQGIYEVRYTPLKSPKLISYNTSVPQGVVNYTVRATDIAGEPEIGRDEADKIPNLEMKIVAGTGGFANMYLAYSYTDQEVAEAMFAGLPLEAKKAMAVRQQFARKLDTIAFYGQSVPGNPAMVGLLNRSGTSTYSVPTTGANNSAKWVDKASDDVILDLNASGDIIITNTNEIEVPDTWLLPLDAYRHVATRRVGDGTSSTILDFFKLNRDEPITVVSTSKSEAANNSKWSGSGSRMVVYKNDPEHLEFMVPVPFLQKAPQYHGMRTTTYCMARFGGVYDYLPKSTAYADGVS